MTFLRRAASTAVVITLLLCGASIASAHDGPPYPIVSNQVAGPYVVSVWTDPDSTDDGSAQGQFWVMAKVAGTNAPVPVDTRATVTITPRDLAREPRVEGTEPVDGDLGRQLAALEMDHEGWFDVRVVITGALGEAVVDAEVEATYDTRPPPAMLFVYLAPFVLVGGLWLRAITRKRRH